MSKFEPWEIEVKVNPEERMLIVRGKRETISDENALPDSEDYECLEYKKHLKIPANVAMDQMKCQLDQNGWLKIEAPTRTLKRHITELTIPVQVVNRSISSTSEEIVID